MSCALVVIFTCLGMWRHMNVEHFTIYLMGCCIWLISITNSFIMSEAFRAIAFFKIQLFSIFLFSYLLLHSCFIVDSCFLFFLSTIWIRVSFFFHGTCNVLTHVFNYILFLLYWILLPYLCLLITLPPDRLPLLPPSTILQRFLHA